MTATNGNGVWKWISGMLATLVLGYALHAVTQPKDAVTQHEMSTQLLILQNKIDVLSNEVAALRTTVNQQNTDLAGIAEKVGVTAHPVVAPVR